MRVAWCHDSLMRHLYQWDRGDTDEDHLGHALFNLCAMIATIERVRQGKLPKSLVEGTREALSFHPPISDAERREMAAILDECMSAQPIEAPYQFSPDVPPPSGEGWTEPYWDGPGKQWFRFGGSAKIRLQTWGKGDRGWVDV